jgi:hypothetical protein
MIFAFLSFYYTRDHVQCLGDGCGELRDANSFVDAPRWDTGRASDGSMRMSEEREGDRRTANWVMRRWRTEVPMGAMFSDEGGVALLRLELGWRHSPSSRFFLRLDAHVVVDCKGWSSSPPVHRQARSIAAQPPDKRTVA